jgi:hypothetical protein
LESVRQQLDETNYEYHQLANSTKFVSAAQRLQAESEQEEVFTFKNLT